MLRRLNLYLLLPILLPILLFLLLSLGGLIYISTHQPQVSDYVASQLSQQLGTTITLSRATMGLHPTPTIDFNQIQLSYPEKGLRANVPSLHIGFSWLDLLRGKLICSKITMIKPDIYWHSHPDDTAPDNAANSRQSSAKQLPPKIGTLLRKAKIVDGSLHIIGLQSWCRNNGGACLKGDSLDIRNLRLQLKSTRTEQLDIKISAKVKQQGGDAQLSLNALVQDISQNWLDAPIELGAKISNLNSATITLPRQYQLNGAYNMQLNLVGQRNSSLNLTAYISATSSGQQLIIGDKPALPMDIIGIDSRLRWDDNQLRTDKLKLRYNKLLIDGELQLANLSDKPHLRATLHSNELEVKHLLPWLPTGLRASLPEGTDNALIQCRQLVIDTPMHSFSAAAIKQLQFSFKQHHLSGSGIHAQNLVANFNWQGRHGSITTTPITFDRAKATVTGPIEIKMTMTDNGAIELDGNLTKMAVDIAHLVVKPAGTSGNLKVAVQRKHDNSTGQTARWKFDSGELVLPNYHLLFSGLYSAADKYQLNLDLPQFKLETISAKVPLLTHMQLKGSISAKYHLQKLPELEPDGSGTIIVNNCAISPTYVIAPIHHINGKIKLDNFSANSTGLQLILGESPMVVDAHIADLRHTVAELHARGDGVRAADLVFNNPAVPLHNLDGRINIHAHGIDFVKASVDLPRGTHAEVTGKLRFKKTLLELQIEAPRANIDEVISLWHHGVEKHRTAATHPVSDNREFIHIDAHVDKGEISGFNFQNATGTIHYRHGRLRIEPLRFEADNGYGNGSIFITSKQHKELNKTATGSYSLLKINGEVHDINADKVYRELLRHNGIVTGTLTGDFTISGPIGSTFLANSQGDFHLRIKDGVLRQFKFISKAFSLLNVAQLFSFNLPDMATEGMPFTLLKGDVSLTDGILHSENMYIKSEAMGLTIIGDYNLVSNKLNLVMGIKPLGTVDTVVNNIPIAGWVLAGKQKSLISTNFNVTGPANDPEVSMLPISSLADKVFGIIKRTITLPHTLFNHPIKILTNTTD